MQLVPSWKRDYEIYNTWFTGCLQKVKDYAKSYIETIAPSPIEDLGNRKAIIASCIEKYKSKDLDNFIKQLDRYLLK